MLIEQGGIVRDNEHLDSLLANGVYRELSWDTPGDKNGGNSLSATATNPDQASTDELRKRRINRIFHKRSPAIKFHAKFFTAAI